ncbi:MULTISPECIES: PaaI family thioesterase [Myroides]|uniref:Hotdog fold thioesterase n=1 Tax=Myroides albus TaxID=2562892 RepID=A0A6I3LQU6_9FLAO|nr:MULTISPECIES: PaaI family thioesterase [Myroides]MTG98335.1 hotdog fold thioesterase [Myroides albus]MVX36080.1 hotdog fold thioesterase [Myroides sp. LoEW2-1]UVD79592.1 PaaI family thioesterase [Myroides albus]
MSNNIRKNFDKEAILEMYAKVSKNTLMETLGIKYVDAGPEYLVATMPVKPEVHQPMGLLHGGASVALAESLGSGASLMLIDPETQEIRGIEISANHVKSKRAGLVTGTAKLIHRGRMLHLWEIRITDENGELISLCKITNIVIDRRK